MKTIIREGVQARQGDMEPCDGGGRAHEGEGSHMREEGGHSMVMGPA